MREEIAGRCFRQIGALRARAEREGMSAQLAALEQGAWEEGERLIGTLQFPDGRVKKNTALEELPADDQELVLFALGESGFADQLPDPPEDGAVLHLSEAAGERICCSLLDLCCALERAGEGQKGRRHLSLVIPEAVRPAVLPHLAPVERLFPSWRLRFVSDREAARLRDRGQGRNHGFVLCAEALLLFVLGALLEAFLYSGTKSMALLIAGTALFGIAAIVMFFKGLALILRGNSAEEAEKDGRAKERAANQKDAPDSGDDGKT